MRVLSLASGRLAASGGAPREVTNRERALLIALIAIYAEVIVALAFTGRFTFIYKTAIVPALIIVALVTRRIAAFVEDWAVFMASIILFDAFRGLVYCLTVHFDLPVHAAYVVRADEFMLGRPLSVILQQALFRSGTIGPLEKLLTVIHGSHFLFFLLVGMAVWLFRREQFGHFRRAFLLLMGLGITAYFAVPTVPPWMAAELHIIWPIRHITAEIYNLQVPTLQATFDTNPIAAMPSLHTAFPTLCSLITWHHFGRKAIGMPIYTLLVYFAIAYMGEHYLIDILAGIALATFVYWMVYRSRWAQGAATATRAPRVQRAWLRQAVVALLIVGASEAIGDLSSSLQEPLRLGPAFVQNDMVGRSDQVHYTLGRYAFSRQDYATARRELRLSLDELGDASHRQHAAELLARLPP